jgi:hypothetical protein
MTTKSAPGQSRNEGVSRRDVVAAAAVLIACGSAAPVPAAAGEDGAIEALLSAIRDRAAAEEVGRAALRSFPDAAPGGCAGLLLADLDLTARDLLSATPEALRIRISQRVRDDFAAGRVNTIDGWRLTSTEARLYALAARARARG